MKREKIINVGSIPDTWILFRLGMLADFTASAAMSSTSVARY